MKTRSALPACILRRRRPLAWIAAALLCLGGALAPPGLHATPDTFVSIDAGQRQGTIPRRILGVAQGWSDGFNAFWPLDNPDTFVSHYPDRMRKWSDRFTTSLAGRPSLMELDLGLFRYGSGQVKNYLWNESIGPVNLRDPGLGDTISNCLQAKYVTIGTDEYLQTVEDLGSEVLMQAQVNAVTASSKRMGAWVAYCNAADPLDPTIIGGDSSLCTGGGACQGSVACSASGCSNHPLQSTRVGQWVQWRMRNGHFEPYNARIWELGNENWTKDPGALDIQKCVFALWTKHMREALAGNPPGFLSGDDLRIGATDNPTYPPGSEQWFIDMGAALDALGFPNDFWVYHAYHPATSTGRGAHNPRDFSGIGSGFRMTGENVAVEAEHVVETAGDYRFYVPALGGTYNASERVLEAPFPGLEITLLDDQGTPVHVQTFTDVGFDPDLLLPGTTDVLLKYGFLDRVTDPVTLAPGTYTIRLESLGDPVEGWPEDMELLLHEYVYVSADDGLSYAFLHLGSSAELWSLVQSGGPLLEERVQAIGAVAGGKPVILSETNAHIRSWDVSDAWNGAHGNSCTKDCVADELDANEPSSLLEHLDLAGMLHALLRNGTTGDGSTPLVDGATLWFGFNSRTGLIGGLDNDDASVESPWPSGAYPVMKILRDYTLDERVEAAVTAPTYTVRPEDGLVLGYAGEQLQEVPFVDVLASASFRDDDPVELAVLVVNRDRDAAHTVQVSLGGFTPAATATGAELSPTSLLARNSAAEEPMRVEALPDLPVSDPLEITVPAHSIRGYRIPAAGVDLEPPLAPVMEQVSVPPGLKHQLAVDWSHPDPSDVSAYRVYRSRNPVADGAWGKQIAEIDGATTDHLDVGHVVGTTPYGLAALANQLPTTSACSEKEITYYYSVTAVDAAGNESGHSGKLGAVLDYYDADGDCVTDNIDNCPACSNFNQNDGDLDGVGDDCTDLDGDGYTRCEGDCAWTDPAIFPGATEVCDDTKDNDCDGKADCLDEDCVGFPGCPEPCAVYAGPWGWCTLALVLPGLFIWAMLGRRRSTQDI